MTRDEALMQQALYALVWEAGSEPALYAAQTYAAIAALRERLARPVHKEVDDLANAPEAKPNAATDEPKADTTEPKAKP